MNRDPVLYGAGIGSEPAGPSRQSIKRQRFKLATMSMFAAALAAIAGPVRRSVYAIEQIELGRLRRRRDRRIELGRCGGCGKKPWDCRCG